MRPGVIIVNAALAAVQIGCARSDPARSGVDTVTAATVTTPGSAANASTTGGVPSPEQPIAIHTIGNKMVLGLANDTVYMGLSDSLLARTRADIARERDTSAGMGSAFADMIRKGVGNALGKRVAYPISDIRSIRYDNGEIKFDYRTRHVMSFESISTDHRKALASFAPADAERFVTAVNLALKRDDSSQ